MCIYSPGFDVSGVTSKVGEGKASLVEVGTRPVERAVVVVFITVVLVDMTVGAIDVKLVLLMMAVVMDIMSDI